jgi:SUMO ligase MMS21 Smc5/6 complex component
MKKETIWYDEAIKIDKKKVRKMNNIENKAKNHIFIYKSLNIFEVRCKVTGGNFCTSVWNKGLIKQNICPCCGEEVK